MDGREIENGNVTEKFSKKILDKIKPPDKVRLDTQIKNARYKKKCRKCGDYDLLLPLLLPIKSREG